MNPDLKSATCEFCGTKYLKESIQAKIQQIRGEVEITGAVETFSGEAEKERLIKNAETYLRINEYSKATEAFENVIKNFPDDYRGWLGTLQSQVESYFQSGVWIFQYYRKLN